jgi:hypothetical protein
MANPAVPIHAGVWQGEYIFFQKRFLANMASMVNIMKLHFKASCQY